MSFLKHDKPLIRRTFLQERFLILIKKQEDASATFAELTELDEIINRDPKLTHIILEEMEGDDQPSNGPMAENFLRIKTGSSQNLAKRIKAFIKHLINYSAHQMQAAHLV